MCFYQDGATIKAARDLRRAQNHAYIYKAVVCTGGNIYTPFTYHRVIPGTTIHPRYIYNEYRRNILGEAVHAFRTLEGARKFARGLMALQQTGFKRRIMKILVPTSDILGVADSHSSHDYADAIILSKLFIPEKIRWVSIRKPRAT